MTIVKTSTLLDEGQRATWGYPTRSSPTAAHLAQTVGVVVELIELSRRRSASLVETDRVDGFHAAQD